MKRIFMISAILVTMGINIGCTQSVRSVTATPAEAAVIHSPDELVTDWQTAFSYLQEGNKRYTEEHLMKRESNTGDREILKAAQAPFAVVVTCSDSRVSPELYFDQKLGDIFVIRNAGNISDPTTLGSIEYAVEHLQAPLVVVVGHSSCGAVTGAWDGGEYPENLETIIESIQHSISGSDDLDEAIVNNVTATVQTIAEDEIIKEMGTKVIGGCYDLTSGTVSWLE